MRRPRFTLILSRSGAFLILPEGSPCPNLCMSVGSSKRRIGETVMDIAHNFIDIFSIRLYT